MNDSVKKTYEKTIVVPIEHDMWAALRKISYEQHLSMNKLAREAFKKVIKKYDKSVDIY